MIRRHLLQPSAVSGPARDGWILCSFPSLFFIRTCLRDFHERGGDETGFLSKCVSLVRIKQFHAPLSVLFSMSMSNKHFGKIIKQANPRRRISISISSETLDDSRTERKQIKDCSGRISGYNSRNYNSYKTATIIYTHGKRNTYYNL